MISFTGPVHRQHQTLYLTKTPISGDPFFRRDCEPPRRPMNVLHLSNSNGSHPLQLPASHNSSLPRMAAGSNVSEVTDDMVDDLIKKHGKVVFKRNERKPTSAEVDDKAESLSFALALAKVASDVKAADIRLLFVEPLVYWTRFFIIATAFSPPQIAAIARKMRDLAETEYGTTANGDYKPNSWTLLDLGDVIVHIFLPELRAFYNLEEFYGNAKRIGLPFEDQQQPSTPLFSYDRQ